MLILIREVSRIGRRGLDEERMLLVRRGIGAIARQADEHRITVRRLPVDFPDEEILGGRIDGGMPQLRGAVAEIAAVRNRVEQVEVRLDERADRHSAGRQHAVVRGRVRQTRQMRQREVLPKAFVAAEVEQPVLRDWTARRAAELVAPEWRVELPAGARVDRIEVVRLVELAVAQELE